MLEVSTLLDAENIEVALSAELSASRKLLPLSSLGQALDPHTSEAAEWLHGLLSTNWQPSIERMVAASKARHGVRPIAVWDLPSSVLYRALTSKLSDHLEAPVRSSAAWKEFQESPLQLPGRYIVAADIAACYPSIDHGELSRELTIQTGAGDVVTQIIGLLQATSGRSYGLPQQSYPSDILAEAFLGALERRLVRKGLDLARYNDDFLINCQSWSEVVRTIEVLSEETRAVGLLLNDAKVLTYRRSTYQERLARVETLRETIAAEAEIDLAQILEDYDDAVVIKADQEEVDRLTAVKVLERWRRIAGGGHVADRNRVEYAAVLRLLPVAFQELSKTAEDSEAALNISRRLLRYEQTITPAVCDFYTSRTDESPLLATLDKLLTRRTYLTGWQTWWLQQPLARLDLSAQPGASRRARWLRAAYDEADRSPVLRAHTARTMARHHLIRPDQLLTLYDRSSAVERPVVVEAMALSKPPGNLAKAVTGDNKLYKWIFDWATQHA
ncbi:RNA-directed DNA polymerase [Kribbella sp. NPDC020789]